MDIKKVAVIGSGVMGSGIAAQVANAGVPVVLMDIVPEGAENRNALAEGAVARLLKQDPAPFMHPRNAKLIEPANLEDDLGKLADCDWIVEAVLEDLAVKYTVYNKINLSIKSGAAVTSNTSTIPLARLLDGMDDGFAAGFFITHFFNPPRYLRLLETVSSPRTDPAIVAAVSRFCDVRLGKTVIACNDTPGFIANRIGGYWIQSAINGAMDLGLTVEEADAVGGRPMGVPRTGVFGLLDLVGIDLIPRVAASMIESLPPDDPYVRDFREHDLVRRMIEDGYTGRKGKGGFYRLNREGGGKVKESVDLATGDYAPSRRSELESARAGSKDLRALVDHPDPGGEWAWRVLSNVIGYSAALVPGIAESAADVDAAMRLGYAWKRGPFELADRLGPAYVAGRLRAEGRDVPVMLEKVGAGTFYRVEGGRLQVFGADGAYRPVERPDGVLLLEDIKRAGEPVESNASASLWDIGDGVACFEVHTRMNALDPDVVTLLQKSLKIVEKEFKALVLYNEGSNFSVGANLGLALFAANVGVWPMIEGMLENGQKAMKAMKYAAFPVVAAPSGMALGGGCELLLHSAAVQAHAETYAGLVEAGVGVLPGWGGCKELLVRHTQDEKRPNGPLPPVAKAFEQISMAAVAKSAQEARDMHILREGDGITMNRDRLLYEAKQKALSLLDGYEKPEPAELNLPGPNGRAALDLAVEGFALQGVALPHDRTVAGEIATVLTGGATDVTETVSEDRLFALERESFMKLLKTEPTLARIEHMLDTGKPLRN
ncbi:MAG: 3-hydroxyacyl-CoA dehydrogenase [Rhodospirillaceae bacterium]|nr:3-hydroxyacyl-CoA dehydrogenase [Rhodospirillaceae bacterium]MYH36579.1 3-hydroxyacyl-CoA dehydrogenase [Rhodospirillaceae bacterium]MYK14069.1 3-hydroxyacyl-CoA dehydrogenase [Rhodospirillaceae bacterium]